MKHRVSYTDPSRSLSRITGHRKEGDGRRGILAEAGHFTLRAHQEIGVGGADDENFNSFDRDLVGRRCDAFMYYYRILEEDSGK